MFKTNLQQGMEGMIWRVGCYKINPTTPSGQKFFILHMVTYNRFTTSKCYKTPSYPPAGAAADPHHSPRHPERRHHEHPHVILLQVGISRNIYTIYILHTISTPPESLPSGGRSAAQWRLQSSSRTSRWVASSSDI